MLARCTEDITVPACNIGTLAGGRVRKDQHIKAGELLPVVREYVTPSFACRGDLIYVLERDGYRLHVPGRYMEYLLDAAMEPEKRRNAYHA